MDDLHLDIHDFGDAWDIGQVAPFESIVTGGRLMLLQEARDGSVVNKDGTPADVMVAAAAKKLGIEPFIPQTPQIPAEELLAVQVAAEKAEQDRIALEATAALAASKKKK